MPVLATIASLATLTGPAPDLSVTVSPPPQTAPRLWYAVTGGEWAGPGGVFLQGDLGLDGPVTVQVTVNHRRIDGFRAWSTAALGLGRELDRDARLDVQVWRDLGRTGRGAGLALTLPF